MFKEVFDFFRDEDLQAISFLIGVAAVVFWGSSLLIRDGLIRSGELQAQTQVRGVQAAAEANREMQREMLQRLHSHSEEGG